jgi:hypothetical protein
VDTTTHPEAAARPVILRIAFDAAQVDGRLDPRDRRRLDAWAAQRAISADRPLATGVVLRCLPDPHLRRMAFEAALGACSADRLRSAEETRYLADLGRTLGLSLPQIAAPAATADALVTMPLPDPTSADAPAGGEESLLRAARACAALGAVATPLATLAAIVVQRRLVFRIVSERGAMLDEEGVRDRLLAGAGLAAQYVELCAAYLEPHGIEPDGVEPDDADGAADGATPSHAAARVAFAHAFAASTLARRTESDGGPDADSAAVYRDAFDDGARRFAAEVEAIESLRRALGTTRLPAFVRAH